MGATYEVMGELERSRAAYESALRLAEEIGAVATQARLLGALALLEAMAGSLTDADLRRMFEASEPMLRDGNVQGRRGPGRSGAPRRPCTPPGATRRPGPSA